MHFVWKHEHDSQLGAHRLLFHWLCVSVDNVTLVLNNTCKKSQKKKPVTTLQANLAKELMMISEMPLYYQHI